MLIALWLVVGAPPLDLCYSVMALPAEGSDHRPAAGTNNTWYEYIGSDTVLIFVHGLLSDSRTAWYHRDDERTGAYWPELLRGDERFAKVGIFLGGYSTRYNSQEYGIRDAANELYRSLTVSDEAGRPPPLERETIIFVAHSLGGIVVRHMLLRHSEDFRSKVVGLLLIASPSGGSADADRLGMLSDFAQHRQGRELRLDSPILEELDRDFRAMVARRELPYLVGMEAYEDKFVVEAVAHLGKGAVVDSQSAGRYFEEPMRLAGTDHFSAAKPNDRRHPSYMVLVYFYQRKLPPVLRRYESERDGQTTENAPGLESCNQEYVFNLIQAADLALGQNDEALAEWHMSSIERCRNVEAKILGMRGKIAFYKRQYEMSVKLLLSASKNGALQDEIVFALGDALVEVGRIGEAIEEYAKVKYERSHSDYKIGRAFLLGGDAVAAIDYLEDVPTSYRGRAPENRESDDRGKGRARVLEAAAYAALARNERDPTRRSQLLELARKRYLEGAIRAPMYWHGVIAGTVDDREEPFEGVKKLLRLLVE